MGMKYFCDGCGEETDRNYVSERLKPEFRNGKVKCEVIVAIDGSWNGGVICEECLRAALRQPEKKEENVLDELLLHRNISKRTEITLDDASILSDMIVYVGPHGIFTFDETEINAFYQAWGNAVYRERKK